MRRRGCSAKCKLFSVLAHLPADAPRHPAVLNATRHGSALASRHSVVFPACKCANRLLGQIPLPSHTTGFTRSRPPSLLCPPMQAIASAPAASVSAAARLVSLHGKLRFACTPFPRTSSCNGLGLDFGDDSRPELWLGFDSGRNLSSEQKIHLHTWSCKLHAKNFPCCLHSLAAVDAKLCRALAWTVQAHHPLHHCNHGLYLNRVLFALKLAHRLGKVKSSRGDLEFLRFSMRLVQILEHGIFCVEKCRRPCRASWLGSRNHSLHLFNAMLNQNYRGCNLYIVAHVHSFMEI